MRFAEGGARVSRILSNLILFRKKFGKVEKVKGRGRAGNGQANRTETSKRPGCGWLKDSKYEKA